MKRYNKTKMKMPSPSRVVFNFFNYLIFGLLTFMCIYPMWFVFIYTISDPSRSKRKVPALYPLGFSLFNFEKVLQIDGLAQALQTSVLRTVLGTCVTVISCMLLGYVFSKPKFPARTFLYRMLIVTMYISGGIIPTFLVNKAYGLVNNFLVYIIPTAISAYYVILIKTFLEQLPISLEESALIDGAGYLTIFARIIMPLSKPIVATIAVYSAVGQWNSWFDNHIYGYANKKMMTLQYLLYKYLQKSQQLIDEMLANNRDVDMSQMMTPFGIKMTVTLITLIPILLVYPFLQRYIIKGMLIGAVKG